MESLMIIWKGTRCRVRDGLKIRIWGHSWLPRASFFKVLSPIPMGWSHELTIRSLLIDAEKTEWNASLIHGIFSEDKTTLILSIPLSLFHAQDVLIWIAEKMESSQPRASTMRRVRAAMFWGYT